MKKQKLLPAPPAQNVPDKKDGKQALKKYTPEEAKEFILGSRMLRGDVSHTLKTLSEEILPKFLHGTSKEKRAIEKDANSHMSVVVYGFETETHVTLMESFGERYRGGAKVICEQFIRDLECKTDAEKVMAETAAVGFMRYLDASRRLNNCLDVDLTITPNKTAFMAMLSKERDRAHRQYLSTVSTIKQLKAPAIEMNIRAKTAFVSHNQQINAENQSNENIDAK